MSPPTKSFSSSDEATYGKDDFSEYWANTIAGHIDGYDPKNAKSVELDRIRAVASNKALRTIEQNHGIQQVGTESSRNGPSTSTESSRLATQV